MENDYTVKRRIKQQQLRRRLRRSEIMLRRTYKFVRFIFILLIFYGVYRLAMMHYWYFPQNIYNEPLGKHIEILGNLIVSNDKILNEMKKFPLPNEPIYRINPAPIANQIEQLAPVKRAYVRRYWFPARLVVMIEEVTPALVVAPVDNAPPIVGYAITGELIEKEFLPLNPKCKAIKVLSYGTNGDDYKNWDLEKIKKLNKLAMLLQEYSGEKVLYIDLRNPHNAYVQLETVKLKIGELDISVFERIKAIQNILPAVKRLTEKTKYIDLSWRESKYVKLDNDEQ